MHLFSSTLAGLALAGLACNAANAESELKPSADPAFNTFLARFEEGISHFLNGDRHMWKDNASKRDDVTVMGAWGAYEKGWQQASPRYDWAAARFQESGAKVAVEYVSTGVSGDLAYTIAIERSTVRLAGMDEPKPMALRVTHLFRKEEGDWKMIHRHADPLMEKTAPKATLQD
jgi:ketosteroid isomerase-like protein